MCEPLPGAGEWGRTRALHPCCAVAWEHSALKYGYTVYIACQALDILAGAADRLALSGSIWLITAHIVPVVHR